MTTLGINAIGTRHSGAATVLLSLLDELREAYEFDRVVVFASPRTERRFHFPDCERISVVEVPNTASNLFARFLWLQTRFRQYVEQSECELVLNLNNLAGKASVPQILFLQQSLYFSQEALHRYFVGTPYLTRLRMMLQPPLMRLLLKISAQRAQAVIVQTEMMKALTSKELGIPVDSIHVAYPTIPAFKDSPVQKNGLILRESADSIHWLYVGNGSPYKNLAIIHSVAQLAQTAGRRWHFHLVGPQHASFAHPAVHWHPYATSQELCLTYKEADGFLMPSLTETVGLPLLEAMSTRVPILAADRPYAREMCGNGACYFDPTDANDLYKQMEHLVGHNGLKDALLKEQELQLTRIRQRASATSMRRILSNYLPSLKSKTSGDDVCCSRNTKVSSTPDARRSSREIEKQIQ